MRKTVSLAIGLIALISSHGAFAAPDPSDVCRAVAITDAPAYVADGLTVMRRGAIDTAFSEFHVYPKTGVRTLCQHGGDCYLAADMRLINCHVDKHPLWRDADTISYAIEP